MPNFPGSLDSLANPTATTLRNDPGFQLHSVISTLNDIAEQLEAKLGISDASPQDSPLAGTILTSLVSGRTKWDSKLQLGAGSAATPSYSTSGDPDTGGYSVGADIWGISAGAQLVAQFKRSGSGLLGVRIGSGTFSETIGGDGDLFVKRGLNIGSASAAASGEIRTSGPLLLNSMTVFSMQQSSAAISSGLTLTALNVTDPIGIMLVSNTYDGAGAFFHLAGGNPVAMAAGAAGTYSSASGTASRANIYRDGATSKVTIQNNLPSTATFYCIAFTNKLTGGGVQ